MVKKERKFDWKMLLVLSIFLLSVALMIGGIYKGIENYFVPQSYAFESLMAFSLGVTLLVMMVILNMFLQTLESFKEIVKNYNQESQQEVITGYVTFDANGKPIKRFNTLEELHKYRSDMLNQTMKKQDMIEGEDPNDTLKKMSIKELEAARKQAVKESDFEWAASIRDEIERRKKE